MKEEFNNIVLMIVIMVFTVGGLFGVGDADKGIRDKSLVKEIKVVNESDYKVKLIFSEHGLEESEMDETILTVDAHDNASESLTIFGLGAGKIISKLRYIIIEDNGEESEPFDAIISWDKSTGAPKLNIRSQIPQKIRFDIRKDLAKAKDKILFVTIKNAVIQVNKPSENAAATS